MPLYGFSFICGGCGQPFKIYSDTYEKAHAQVMFWATLTWGDCAHPPHSGEGTIDDSTT